MMGKIRVAFLAAAIIGLFPAVATSADSVPMPKAVNSLSTALLALGAAGNEMVQMDRATKRLEAVRAAFTKQMLMADADSRISLSADSSIEERALLCGVRVDHIATVARFGYLNSVAAQIQEISKPTNPTDLGSALKALFATYAIKASDASLKADTLRKVQAEVRNRCEKDIAGFDRAYYGVAISAPAAEQIAAAQDRQFALEAFGPIGSLIDTVIGIITPIAIEAATLVDETKREQAVRSFLSKPENQAVLKDVGAKLSSAISQFTWNKRLKLAGSVTEQINSIKAIQVDLGKIPACNNLPARRFARAASKAPSPEFMTCAREAWAPYEKPLAEVLKTAEDYDAMADAGDSDTATSAFKGITQDLNAVGENAVTDPQVLWQYVTQLVGFANTLQKAFSPDNREKLQKAIDAAVKSL